MCLVLGLLLAACDPGTDGEDGGRTDAGDAGPAACAAAPAFAPAFGADYFCPSVGDGVRMALAGELDAELLDAGCHSYDDAGADAGGACNPWDRGWAVVLGCSRWELCQIGIGTADGGVGCYHCAAWGPSPWGL
jgi:hypothetical protein